MLTRKRKDNLKKTINITYSANGGKLLNIKHEEEFNLTNNYFNSSLWFSTITKYY